MKKTGICVVGSVLAAAAGANAATVTNIGNVWQLGDSITWGDGWVGGIGTGTETPTPGGYRTAFYNRLTADGFSYQAVGSVTTNPSPTLKAAGETANEGHPGFDMSNIQTDLTGYNGVNNPFDPGHWLTGTGNTPGIFPDYTVVNVGVNDLIEGIGAPFDATVVLPGFLKTIYDNRPNTKLILSSLLPDANSASVNNSINVFNSYLPSVVSTFQSEGYSITYDDAHALFMNGDGSINNSLLFDGLHPNQAGYNLLGNSYAASVESAVPEPTAIALALPIVALLGRRRTNRATVAGPVALR